MRRTNETSQRLWDRNLCSWKVKKETNLTECVKAAETSKQLQENQDLVEKCESCSTETPKVSRWRQKYTNVRRKNWIRQRGNISEGDNNYPTPETKK